MTVEVHIEWRGTTTLVGNLHATGRGQSVAFVYAAGWLGAAGAFAIDPTSLPLRPGPHHAGELFGVVQDCGPDRWGRVLIERAVRKLVLPKKPYRDMDYVLALDDASRIGALRFRMAGGPFLAATRGRLPPIVRLAALQQAADAIHGETETAQDLRFLLGEGSPLGGARPKSAVSLADGRLAIAKFRRPDDTRDVAAGEILALSLAQAAGGAVAEHRLVTVARHNVAVITRFDRAGASRIPFLSGASLLGAGVGDPGAYTRLADGIRQCGDDVQGDLGELWRRMVFSLLASNSDDHLRNHGFLMHQPGRWSLSPAYDLNPVPEVERGRGNQTPLSEEVGEPSIDQALGIAGRFGLKATAAKTILREVYVAVAGWRHLGQRLRLGKATLDAYASAFEHAHLDETRRLLRR